MWREHAAIEWVWRVISIGACFQSVKFACLTLELSDCYTDEQKNKLISKIQNFKFTNLNRNFNPYQ